MGLSFLVMLLAVGVALESAPIGLQWLLITYLLQTFGELALSPIGLSAFSRYSPKRYVGQMFGLWFLASAIGGVLAGVLVVCRSAQVINCNPDQSMPCRAARMPGMS